MPGPVNLVSRQGTVVAVPEADIDAALAQGFRYETADEATSRAFQERRDDAYGGVLGKVASGLSSAVDAATLGGYSAALRAAGAEEGIRAVREANPTSALVGGLVGGLVTGRPGAGLTPAAAAANLGARVARVGEEAGAVAKVARAGAGAAVEGAITGLGQGVTDLALSGQPIDAEHAAGLLSSQMLLGGAVGGAAGSAAKLAEVGLVKARGALDELAARPAAGAAGDIPSDIAKLDKRGLKAAEEAEKASIETARVPQREAIVRDLEAFSRDSKEAEHFLTTKGIRLPAAEGKLATSEIGKISSEANKQIDRLLRNPAVLAEDVRPALRALKQQEHAYSKLLERDPELRLAYAAEAEARAAKSIPEYQGLKSKLDEAGEDFLEKTIPARDIETRGWYEPPGGHTDPVRIAKARKAIEEGQREAVTLGVSPSGKVVVTDGRHRLAAAAELGKDIKVKWTTSFEPAADDVMHAAVPGGATRAAALDTIPAALEKNRALQARLSEITAAPSSERLAAIGAAKEAFENAPAKTAAEEWLGRAAGFAAPIAGPIAAIFGRLGKAVGEARARGAKAAAAFLGGAEQAVAYSAPLATRVLTRTAFAPSTTGSGRSSSAPLPPASAQPPAAAAASRARAPSPAGPLSPGRQAQQQMIAAFRARTAELRSQVTMGPDGQLEMSQEARSQLAARLAPLMAYAPTLADGIETVTARKVAYLATTMPRRPEMAGLPIGPDSWHPSDMEMRSWAKRVAAAEDPWHALEGLAAGHMTPEAAETIRVVYPELYQEITTKIILGIGELRARMPRQNRIALSVFTGRPIDPSMDPGILDTLQAQYDAPTDQTPRATPQFGSVARNTPEVGTPSQRREQGAA